MAKDEIRKWAEEHAAEHHMTADILEAMCRPEYFSTCSSDHKTKQS